jgi:hypothetical protein
LEVGIIADRRIKTSIQPRSLAGEAVFARVVVTEFAAAEIPAVETAAPSAARVEDVDRNKKCGSEEQAERFHQA